MTHVGSTRIAEPSIPIDPRLPRATGRRGATKLVYLAVDDPVQSEAGRSTLARLGATPAPGGKAYSLAFYDGAKAAGAKAAGAKAADAASGDARLVYFPDSSPHRSTPPVESPVAPGVSEVLSCDPVFFSRLLRHVFERYPSRRRYLHLITHGVGVRGLLSDFDAGPNRAATHPVEVELPDGTRRPLAPLHTFAAALRGAAERPFDLVYFDACYMGNLEALFELRDVMRFAVASESPVRITRDDVLTLPVLFERLVRGGETPRSIALALASHAGAGGAFASVVAVELRRVGALVRAFDGLVGALQHALPTRKPAMVAAYQAASAQSLGLELGDLAVFATALGRRVREPHVAASLRRLRSALRAALLYESPRRRGACGLSVFLPPLEAVRAGHYFLRGAYQKTQFAQGTGWAAFLEALAA